MMQGPMGPMGGGVLMANTKRETGKKVQQGNIMAAKAGAAYLAPKSRIHPTACFSSIHRRTRQSYGMASRNDYHLKWIATMQWGHVNEVSLLMLDLITGCG